MSTVKSIVAVNTTAGWAARQRNTDGTELFVIAEREGARYTMHQAQAAADSLRSHLANGGETYATPLPAGVRVVKS